MEEEAGGWVERKQLMKTELLLNGGRGEYGGGAEIGETKGEDLKIPTVFRYNTAKMEKKKHNVVSRHTA